VNNSITTVAFIDTVPGFQSILGLGFDLYSLFQSRKSEKELVKISSSLSKIVHLVEKSYTLSLTNDMLHTFITLKKLCPLNNDGELIRCVQTINNEILEATEKPTNNSLSINEKALDILKKIISGKFIAKNLELESGRLSVTKNSREPLWNSNHTKDLTWPIFRINEKKIITHIGLRPKLILEDTITNGFSGLLNAPFTEKKFFCVKENIKPFSIAPYQSRTKDTYSTLDNSKNDGISLSSTNTLLARLNGTSQKIFKQTKPTIYKRYRSNNVTLIDEKHPKNASQILYKIKIKTMIDAIQQAKSTLETKHEPATQLSIIRECYSHKFKILYNDDAKCLLELSLQLATMLASSNNTKGIKYILRYTEYLLSIINR